MNLRHRLQRLLEFDAAAVRDNARLRANIRRESAMNGARGRTKSDEAFKGFVAGARFQHERQLLRLSPLIKAIKELVEAASLVHQHNKDEFYNYSIALESALGRLEKVVDEMSGKSE